MYTTLFLSFSRLVFYLPLESVIAISIHIDTLIFFPDVLWFRFWKAEEKEKYFTRKSILKAINTEEKGRILMTIIRYNPRLSSRGKRLFLFLNFLVYPSGYNALLANMTHHIEHNMESMWIEYSLLPFWFIMFILTLNHNLTVGLFSNLDYVPLI